MPTTLRRAAVSITPQVQHALDVAAQRWPDAAGRPATLLAKLAVDSAGRYESRPQRNSDGLFLVPRAGRVITSEMVYEALANDI
ncbi:MAG: hypothetical protein LBH13_03835 [Cellulomonadaceae bacterium]|nr:hypothetical protein [Cellulomonadaceae bacterium]